MLTQARRRASSSSSPGARWSAQWGARADLCGARRCAAALASVKDLGTASVGDKTMVDALEPAVETLRARLSGGASVADALGDAGDAAEAGMRSTIPLQARKGRASYLGERSIGHQDPGATSTALIIRALQRAVAQAS